MSLSAPRVIGFFLLALGVLYAVWLFLVAFRSREEIRQEKGNIAALCVLEAFVYFFATVGMSDFLPNTLAIRYWKLTDNKNLPGTLIAAALTPGAVIAFFLLRAEQSVEMGTLIPCCLAIASGGVCGSRIVGKIDGKKIKKIMGIALIFSMAAIIVRMVISEGTSGTMHGLAMPRLLAAVVCSFLFGLINMLGVPTKAGISAMFLLLGVAPLSALTIVLVMGCIGPMSGGVAIIRERRYHQKIACASVVFGSLGAAVGSMLAISVSPLALNILLLVVLAVAIVSMLKAD